MRRFASGLVGVVLALAPNLSNAVDLNNFQTVAHYAMKNRLKFTEFPCDQGRANTKSYELRIYIIEPNENLLVYEIGYKHQDEKCIDKTEIITINVKELGTDWKKTNRTNRIVLKSNGRDTNSNSMDLRYLIELMEAEDGKPPKAFYRLKTDPLYGKSH